MTPIVDLKIRCGHCRAEFPGPAAIGDIEALDAAIAAGLHDTCPSCGQVVDCSRKNMMWHYADGSGGGLYE